MLPTDLIKKIENNHNIYDILSNELPIWQYIRNLLYNQILFSNQNNTSNRIKDSVVETESKTISAVKC